MRSPPSNKARPEPAYANPGKQKMFTLQQVIAALVIGMFIGANVGIVVLALLRMAGDSDRHMPDIDDI